MTTAKQLQEEMRAYHQLAVRTFQSDGTHGTMLFPFRDGRPTNVLGLAGAALGHPAQAELAAARVRVSVMEQEADALIVIYEAMVLLSRKQETRPLSQHPDRQHALIISAATRDGFRLTSAVLFDEQRQVMSYLNSDAPGVVMLSGEMLDALGRPLFDPDAERWRAVLDRRIPGWRDQQQVTAVACRRGAKVPEGASG